jgi:hypothetical protein
MPSQAILRSVSVPPRVVRVPQASRCLRTHAKSADGPRVAIVGITGAVGQEFLRVRSRAEHRRNTSSHWRVLTILNSVF